MPELRPSYYEKEKKYLEAKTPEEKLQALREMLSAIPKNKATEKIIMNILKRIAKLKEEIEEKRRISKRLGRKSILIPKEGAATISLFSFPNSGKSWFLNKYTRLNLKSTSIPFETQKPVPAIIKYKKIPLQFIEIPSIYEGFSDKNREIMNIVRNSDIIVSFISPEYEEEYQKKVIIEELKKCDIYIGERPKVRVIKESKGGIKFMGDFVPENPKNYIEILQTYGIHNATVIFDEPVDLEKFAIAIDPSSRFIKLIFTKSSDEEIFEKVVKEVGIIRIFTKEPGKKPDLEEPLCLRKGATIRDLIEELNESWLKSFKYARVWGPSAKYPGERVGLDHVLEDGDIVEIKI